MKKINFSAGPSILPDEVFQKGAEAMIEFENTGMSIAEISHRNKAFVTVFDEARELVKEILGVPEGYSVLFLQGGASLQFLMAPMNLLSVNGKAAYTDTGTWASKAIKEAKGISENILVLASSKDKNYTYIPKDYVIPSDVEYFHCTSNNTIFGTQMKQFPETNVPIACDMSSDIFSREVDVKRFGLIYAGAQKNLGPAGVTLVIVKDELLGKTGRYIPTMLDYMTHIKGASMFNTPCTISSYLALINLRYMKKIGGLKVIQKYNEEKAAMLYDEIDRNPLFYGTAEKEDRSLMNVCFLLKDNALEEKFNKLAAEANCVDIKGHRSVGGYRASIYNAMTKEKIQVLIDVMKELERQA